MKKLISAILVLALASFVVFADTDCFEIETEVEGVNMMKITAAQYNPTTPSPEDFEDADAFVGPLVIDAAGDQSFIAYLSTMSNNRTGYIVSMSATAMKSSITGQADAYINYTVKVNTNPIKTLTTNGAASVSPVDVITIPSLTALARESHQISLSVDSTTYNSAAEGSYSGTVTFTFVAT